MDDVTIDATHTTTIRAKTALLVVLSTKHLLFVAEAVHYCQCLRFRRVFPSDRCDQVVHDGAPLSGLLQGRQPHRQGAVPPHQNPHLPLPPALQPPPARLASDSQLRLVHGHYPQSLITLGYTVRHVRQFLLRLVSLCKTMLRVLQVSTV